MNLEGKTIVRVSDWHIIKDFLRMTAYCNKRLEGPWRVRVVETEGLGGFCFDCTQNWGKEIGLDSEAVP